MMELDKPIAVGRTAEIYSWGEGKILKLFLPTIPLDWIEYELSIGQYIQETHLPVPRLFERVHQDGREGMIYERLEGSSMLDELGRKPWKVRQSARLLARLHAQVHTVAAPKHIQTQREWIRGGIMETPWLPDSLRKDVIHLLDSLPDGSQLCHGDFHPGNILLTRHGPTIIDWMTASQGTAAGDVARTSIILEVGKPPPATPATRLIEYLRGMFRSTYFQTYFELSSGELPLFSAWQTVMAANFLDVSLPEERDGLIQRVRLGLENR